MKIVTPTHVSPLVLMLGLAGGAFAQDESDDLIALEEVIVTAQRKPETLQDAAIPISVATAADLTKGGVDNIETLGDIAPALSVTQGGGPTQSFFVRGVGNLTQNGYTDPAIAVNVDDVYIGRPSGTTATFLDVARIEVLKGPQGTLYGRNATGGAINIIPNKPVLGESSTSISVGAGNYGFYEASAASNIEVSENTAIRLSGAFKQNDGYNDDGTSDMDDFALRAQVFTEVSDNFDFRISADYAEGNAKGIGSTPTGRYAFTPDDSAADEGLNLAPTYLYIPFSDEVADPRGGFLTEAAQARLTELQPGFPGPPLFNPENVITVPGWTSYDENDPLRQGNVFWGITGEINLGTPAGDLVIIPAYRKSDLDYAFIGPGFRSGVTLEESDQTTLELRLSNQVGIFDWLVGAHYFDETTDGKASFGQYSLTAAQEYVVDSESFAIFARGELSISDEFRLVGGVRYTSDKKAMDGESNTLVNACLTPPNEGGAGCLGGPNIPVGLTVADIFSEIEALGQFPGGDVSVLVPNPDFVPPPLPPTDPNFQPPLIPQVFTRAQGAAPTPGLGGIVPFGSAVTPDDQGQTLLWNQTFVDPSFSESEVTYRVAAEYDITPENLLYASFETGFRSGTFSLAVGREEAEPEFIDAFTVGSKNRFLDNRLQLNVELFHWIYEDQQVAHFGLDINGGPAFFTENIGESTIQGLDIDLLFQIARNTKLNATIQYLDSNLDEFKFELPSQGDVPPVIGCDAPRNDAKSDDPTQNQGGGLGFYDVDCSGQRGLFSPEWAFNLGIEQVVDLGELELTVNLDGRYRDEQIIGFERLPTQIEDSYVMADLSFTLAPEEGGWYVTLYGNNITDEDVRGSSGFAATPGSLVTSTYTPPATYGARFGLEF